MTLLPSGPWRLDPAFARKKLRQMAACAALALVFGGSCGAIVAPSTSRLLAESATWNAAEVETAADVEGDVRSRWFLFHDHELDVAFTDEAGALQAHELGFYTLGGSADDSVAPVVRYRRGHPEDFALNWAIDVAGSRWIAIALGFGFFGIGFPLMLLFAAFGHWKSVGDARAAAENGHEVELELLAIEPQLANGTPTGSTLYRYRREAGGAPREEVVGKDEGLPIVLDDGRKLLAIVAREGENRVPLVVRAGMFPLQLDERALRETEARIAERSNQRASA